MGLLQDLVKKNDYESIKRLGLEKGSAYTVMTKDLAGNTILLLACAGGYTQILKYALENNAEVNVANKAGDTGLILAIKRNDMEQLLTSGADANKANLHGNTPLHYSAFWRSLEATRVLVDQGNAYVNILNKYQKTPIDLTGGVTKEFLQDAMKEKNANPVAMATITTTDEGDEPVYDWEILASSVQIHEKVAETKCAVIYRGLWLVRQVAVKLPLIKFEPNDKEVRSLRAEINTLRKLNHANLAPILSACTVYPDICYLTDYTNMGDLSTFLHNPDIEMTPAHALKLAFDTVKGLVYLHEWRPPIAHGSLKSKNVLLYADSKIRLVDYGFSESLFNSRVLFPDRFHEPEWLSPEVLRGETIHDPRTSDVYSFGLLLYEIVTRLYLFDETNAMVIGMRIALDNEVPLIPAYVPKPLSELMSKCWHYEPESRPLMKDILTNLMTIKI